MAKIGCDDLIAEIDRLADSFEEVGKKAINEALPILENTVERNLDRYIGDSERSTGSLLKSVYKRKAKKVNKTGNIVGHIGFKGEDENGVRNGLKANVLEYGKKGQAPRPFMRVSVAECEEVVTQKMKNIFETEIERLQGGK